MDVGDDGCLPEGMGGFVGVWVDFGEGGYFPEGMGDDVLIFFGGGELQASSGCRTLALSKRRFQRCLILLVDDPFFNSISFLSSNFRTVITFVTSPSRKMEP